MDELNRFRAFAKRVRTSTTIALWVCVTCAIGLFIASFCVPPMGEISPSVLKAGGEIFAFASLIMLREAIMEGLGVKLTHGHTTIEVHDLDGPAPGHGHHGHGPGPVPEQHEEIDVEP